MKPTHALADALAALAETTSRLSQAARSEGTPFHANDLEFALSAARAIVARLETAVDSAQADA